MKLFITYVYIFAACRRNFVTTYANLEAIFNDFSSPPSGTWNAPTRNLCSYALIIVIIVEASDRANRSDNFRIVIRGFVCEKR